MRKTLLIPQPDEITWQFLRSLTEEWLCSIPLRALRWGLGGDERATCAQALSNFSPVQFLEEQLSRAGLARDMLELLHNSLSGSFSKSSY